MKRRLVFIHSLISFELSNTSLLGDSEVLVSVTTFGNRLSPCALAIHTIGMGAKRPKRVILWLNEDLQSEMLPRRLRKLKRRGLEIRYVKDIRSHKKYFFALEECLEHALPIVTIDDDFIYPPWFLEKLIGKAKSNPTGVFCYRARQMKFSSTGELLPYDGWPFADYTSPHQHIFFTSGGGTFLPLSLIEALKGAGDSFLDHCPLADDIWLNYHAARCDISKNLIFDRSTDFTPLPVDEGDTLWSKNAFGGNDAQLRATFDDATVMQLRNPR